MGLQYRNRVAQFVNKMSQKPMTLDCYKSDPLPRGASNQPITARMHQPIIQGPGPADPQAAMGGTLANFALNPRMTRTGFNAMNEGQQRLGDSIIHNSSVGKHSFLATPMIDTAPAETAGVGAGFEFR